MADVFPDASFDANFYAKIDAKVGVFQRNHQMIGFKRPITRVCLTSAFCVLLVATGMSAYQTWSEWNVPLLCVQYVIQNGCFHA